MSIGFQGRDTWANSIALADHSSLAGMGLQTAMIGYTYCVALPNTLVRRALGGEGFLDPKPLEANLHTHTHVTVGVLMYQNSRVTIDVKLVQYVQDISLIMASQMGQFKQTKNFSESNKEFYLRITNIF